MHLEFIFYDTMPAPLICQHIIYNYITKSENKLLVVWVFLQKS